VEVWQLVGFSAAVLLLGFAARLVFDRWKVPDFLLLIVAGLAIGPAGANALPADLRAGFEGAAGPLLSVTVAFLMMEAGIHLTVEGGRLVTLLILAHTALAGALTFAGAWAVSVYAFGLSPSSATVLAAATLGPSAVVLASFAPKLSIKPQTRQALLFEGILANVLGFFVVMSVPGLGTGSAGAAEWAGALSALALAVMLAGAAGLGWAFVLKHLHPREGVFIATLAVALGIYAVASGPLGGNGAVGAFAFGWVLRRAGGIARERALPGAQVDGAADLGRFHSEASFLVRTFFFLYLGLHFDPALATPSALALALALVAVFLAARYPSCALLRRAWSLGRPDTLVLLGSVSRGLTDILLVLYGISSGLVPAAEAPLLASVIVILLLASLAANGLAILLAERSRKRDARLEQGPEGAPARPQ